MFQDCGEVFREIFPNLEACWYFDWGATISNPIVRKQLCRRVGICTPFAKSFGHSVREGALMLSLGLATTLSTSRRATFGAHRTRLNLDRWWRSRKDGGITMTQRCRYLARWISESRWYLLEHHLHKIWKRHQECGFVLAFDGSKDNKLRFRDVN